MDSFTPNDPMWKLLGKARPVTPRPNFTQDVVRAARQTPQDTGWLSRLRSWLETPGFIQSNPGKAIALGAFAALAITFSIQIIGSSPTTPQAQPQVATATVSPANSTEATLADDDFAAAAAEVAAELQRLEQFDALLAAQETSTADFTDQEIQYLLFDMDLS